MWTRFRNYEPGLNGLDNFYIPTSKLAICLSLRTVARVQWLALTLTRSEALALRLLLSSVDVHITPSTYVYTSFVSDLVLEKSVAVDKTPRQALLFNCLPYWPHIAWARCHHYETCVKWKWGPPKPFHEIGDPFYFVCFAKFCHHHNTVGHFNFS